MPLGVVSFFTAFEIAAQEYRNNRLKLEEVIAVGKVILGEKNSESLIPSYSLCPIDYKPCSDEQFDIKEICAAVKRHIEALCLH